MPPPPRPKTPAEILAEREAEFRKESLESLRRVMETPDGRKALWYILRLTPVFAEKLWRENSSQQGRAVALRDFGMFLSLELASANEPAFFAMQKDGWERAVRERVLDFENSKETT